MASNVANNWKLGLFVVVAVIAAGGAIAWAALENFDDRKTFLAYTYFDEPVSGLSIGSVLQHRGIEIGEVQAIRAASDRKLIQVTCEIDEAKLVAAGLKTEEELAVKREFPPNLRVRLERSLLTGQAFVQTDYYDPIAHPIPDFYPEGFVLGSPTVHSIKSAQATIDQVFETLPRTLERIDNIVAKFETELDAMDLQKLVSDTDNLLLKATDLATATRTKIDALDVPAIQASFLEVLDNGKSTLKDFDEFIKDLRSQDGALYALLTKSKDLLSKIERELESAQVGQATAQIGSAAASLETTLDSARSVLPELIRTLKDAQRLFQTLEKDPGSLIHGRTPPADPRTKR